MRPAVDVVQYKSKDGTQMPVVEIDTSRLNGWLRVYLNDGCIWEGDPEMRGPADKAQQWLTTWDETAQDRAHLQARIAQEMAEENWPRADELSHDLLVLQADHVESAVALIRLMSNPRVTTEGEHR